MKKNSKFVFGLLSAAVIAGGAYYFVKNILNKDSDDDFEDFEDDFEDFDLEDEQTENPSEGREYVTINITAPSEETPEEAMEEDLVEETMEETEVEPEATVEEAELTEEIEE